MEEINDNNIQEVNEIINNNKLESINNSNSNNNIEENIINNRNILENLFKKYGNFIICEYYENINNWSRWILFDKWKNKNSTNKKVLRSIFPEEIVLDIETKDYEDVEKHILDLGLKSKIFDSGGKGIHIHTFFSELKNYNDSIRPYIKEFIIDKLGLGKGDLKKKDNKTLIGAEFYQHRKGQEKKLLFQTDEEFYPDNQFFPEVYDYIKTLPEKFNVNLISDIKPTIIFKDKKPCDAVQRLINKGEKEGKRNYGAMLIVQQLRDYCGYDINECFQILKKYNINCQIPKSEEVIGSDLREQYKRKYNPNCNTFIQLGLCLYKNKENCSKYKKFNGSENKDFIIINDGGIEKVENNCLILPYSDKLISEFALEVANKIKDENILFYRSDSKDIVEIGRVKLHKTSKEIFTGFIYIKPNRFITLAEKFITPGILIYNQHTKSNEFIKKSMSSELANTLLSSYILQQAFPQITRIFTIPLPIIYNGELTFPKEGYDERFLSWLPYDSPKISNPNMGLNEAKDIIKKIYEEFCFKSKNDYINAIAALLTPFLRGLFTSFNTRTPVFFYIGNRERCGKDYCAGITGILYEGFATEENPISNSENNKSNNTDELRKKILAAMISGRKRLHFSNNKGYINNAVFEAVITAEKYSDRLLGKNEILTFENELDFSLSGNIGVGFTPDLANRCRFINFFLDIENANDRKFNNPYLHIWIKNNRDLILSALFSLVKNWIDKNSPKGSLPFASFPQWAEICGGIMEAAGYDNPCTPDKETISLGGDREDIEMKKLFEFCFENFPNKWIKKKEIREFLLNDHTHEIFSYLDLSNRPDQTKFAQIILKFVGRILSDIRLEVKDPNVSSYIQEFRFTKEKMERNNNDFFK